MYIPEFWCGVISAILVEICLIMARSIWITLRQGKYH